EEYGFSIDGKELMFNGNSGEPMECYVYMGSCYYQQLPHQVIEKCYSRSTGPIQAINRQPSEGKSVGGGFRVGEMENTNLRSHGASSTLMHMFKTNSDMDIINICEDCGTMFVSKESCFNCRGSNVCCAQTPYSFKLLSNYLQ